MPAFGWIMGTIKDINGANVNNCAGTIGGLAMSVGDGWYLGVKAPGNYELVVSKSGLDTYNENVSLTEGGTLTKDLIMKVPPAVSCLDLTTSTGSVSGTVHDTSDNAIEEAAVTIGAVTVYTNAQGYYIASILAGYYGMSFVKDGFWTVGCNVTITANHTITGVSPEMPPVITRIYGSTSPANAITKLYKGSTLITSDSISPYSFAGLAVGVAHRVECSKTMYITQNYNFTPTLGQQISKDFSLSGGK